MKKAALSLLFLLCFMQQINARSVLSGESLWALQRLVAQASCDVTIRQIDLTVGVYTISTSGVYCLAENITGKIIIDIDNVVLDLNGKTMTNASGNCVEVNGTSNALIKNGSVIAANAIGIAVLSGSAHVAVKSVATRNCATGINVETSNNIYVDTCELIASVTGMVLNSVSRVEVADTIAFDSKTNGFFLSATSNSLFTKCHALNTGQGLADETVDVYGFLSANGSSNIFSSCIAQNTLALTVTGVPNVAAGFAFIGTESDSRIAQCTSNVTETDVNGFATPYGLLLQYSFDALSTVTGGGQGAQCNAVSWSPDGVYLATGGSTQDADDEIQLFSFDRVAGELTKTDGQSQGTKCDAVAWSPDGAYLATGGLSGGVEEIQVFSLDRVAGKLTRTDAQDQGSECLAVSWSPDGTYLATGGFPQGGIDIQVWSFNQSTGLLTFVTGAVQGTRGFAVAWSPDGAYLATGGFEEAGAEIQIFSFDRLNGTLTKTDGKTQGAAVCRTVAWSSDGAYLATGGDPEGGNDIQVWSFNQSTGTVTFVVGLDHGSGVRAVDWSPDGAYLASATLAGSDNIEVYFFNRDVRTLTKIDGAGQGGLGLAVNWASDGAYLVSGGVTLNLQEFRVFKAFIFPSRNVIINNIVQASSRFSSIQAGVGISGSSIENAITMNSSYNNAGFNYQFVTNVFDERFAQIPTAVQNLSIKKTFPLYAP
ncbi:hypothetical protein E3J61_01420 [Candidatus Dependentiae bacterium]|nr:MAG: hypothetical protein E3J61_01420 [Candidatus Dependentiae bacterium]